VDDGNPCTADSCDAIEALVNEVKRKIRSNGGLEKNTPLATALDAVVRELSGADLRAELETALPAPVGEEMEP
jgi:hypothetical protein